VLPRTSFRLATASATKARRLPGLGAEPFFTGEERFGDFLAGDFFGGLFRAGEAFLMGERFGDAFLAGDRFGDAFLAGDRFGDAMVTLATSSGDLFWLLFW
jgi:hypothetical protein